jgi:hypothetical protein
MRTWLLSVFCIGCGLALAGTGNCQSNWRAPVLVRNAEPLNVLFLQAPPASASVLTGGETRLQLNLDVVNHLLFDRDSGSRLEQDFEVQRLTFTVARGIGNNAEVVVHLPLLARNGGFMDEVINTWHRWFGFKGGGRASHRSYQVHEWIVRDGKTLVSLDGAAIGMGDTTLEVRKSLSRLGRSFWSARVMLKLPTGCASQQFGSGAVDAGAGVVMTCRCGSRLVWHINVSKVWVGRPSSLGVSARDMVQWLFAVEYLADRQTSLVAQIDDNHAPVVIGLPYADGARRSLTIGLIRQIRPGMRAELSLTENQFGWLARIAPDFHLHLGVRWER